MRAETSHKARWLALRLTVLVTATTVFSLLAASCVLRLVTRDAETQARWGLVKDVVLVPELILFLLLYRALRTNVAAHHAVQEAQQLSHEALEHSLTALDIVDAEGLFIYVNDAFLRMWGYTRPEEVLGRSVHGFCGRPRMPGRALDELREKGERQLEFNGIRRDGTACSVLMVSRYFQWQAGRELIISSSLDITPRRQAESAARELAGRLTTTLESITEAFFTVDRSWRLTYVNRAAEQVLKRPRESMLGRVLWEEFPDAEGLFGSGYRRALETGTPVRMEEYYPPPLSLWFEVNAFPSEQGLAIYFRDVTQQHEARELLRDTEERFRTTFEQAPLGICQMGRDGSFEHVNPRLCEMFGYSEEELLARSFVEVTYAEDIPKSRELLQELLDGRRKRFGADKRYLRKGGEVIWAHSAVTVLRDSGGRPRALIAVVEDITARKKAEEERRLMNEQLRALTARMESLREEERVRISREIHDELGQMLTGLKIDLRWVEERLDQSGDAALNPLLERIVSATEVADATLRSVQRIAADLRPGVLDELGLPAALEYEGRRFQERTGILCSVRRAASLPPISAEATTALFRILQECLTNVARHAGATRVRVSLGECEGGLCLSVEDNGHGITESEARGRASLGVLGMRERAMKLGGELSFLPARTGGTVVRVRIPIIFALK